MSNHRLLLIPVLAGLAAALLAGAQRARDEAAYRQVAVACDYAEAAAAAAFAHQPLSAILGRFKDAGLTTVSIEEPTLRELVETGVLRFQSLADGGVEMVAQQGTDQARAAVAAFAERFGTTVIGSLAVRLPVPAAALLDAGCGLDPAAVANVHAAGLQLAARLRNSPGLDGPGIDAAFNRVAAAGAPLVIFSGDQVLGYRDLTLRTAKDLADHNLTWARVEFAEQKGEDKLAEKILDGDHATRLRPGSYVRLHSITIGEMAKMTPAAAIERYRRAAKERNIRVLFVRLLLGPSPDVVETNATHLTKLSAALRASGLETGAATALPRRQPGLAKMVVLGALGIAAAAGWLLAVLGGPYTTGRWLAWWAVFALLPLPLAQLKPALYGQLMGLLAGLVYPTIAGRWVCLQLAEGRLRSAWGALGLLWGAVGLTLGGALMSAGLLTQTRFLLHHGQFLGVKLTQVGPLAAVALIAGVGLSLPGVDGAQAKERLSSFWRQPLRIGGVIAGLIGLVLLAVFVIRSGNEGLEVSNNELRFRTLLEHLFGARPRSKEFLFGDPALVLAGLALLKDRPALARGLAVIGMVGVVSTFNTFCHLHTPLDQSLLRTFHSLWLASVLGLLAGRLIPRATDA